MDVRLRKTEAEEGQLNYDRHEDNKLNDALIFNIIKKLELKMDMEAKFVEQRKVAYKEMPSVFTQYLYSSVALGYFTTAMMALIFLRYKGTEHPT